MIGYLTGTVIKKYEKYVILDVHGVGYAIKGNTNFLSTVGENGNENVSVFIHTHVREDDITLYGFLTSAEKELFLQLISVSGVGPRTALEVLNTPLPLLTQAIFTEDKALLSKVPGIGTKTAEKIILELKNKVKFSSGNLSTATKNVGQNIPQALRVENEVFEALERLGYNRQQISISLREMDNTLKTSEEIITAFLKNI